MSQGDDSGERLREAACVGDLALVTKLESQGIDLNSKNSMNGWTALHWACKRNHMTIVHYLLNKGADRNIKNKDGHIPVQLTSSEEIRQILGAPDEDKEVKSTPLPITPNYLSNPVFPYTSRDTPENHYSNLTMNNSCHKSSGGDSQTSSPVFDMSHELVLKARLANSDEKDFIEIELPHAHLSFAALLNLMCAELGVDKSLVAKIRKLPDTILRKDKDVKRLKDLQELELVLTNKAISASSRTYSLGPARNSETILY